MKVNQQDRQPRRQDEVAQTHTKMLKLLQTKTLDKDEHAKKITTTIDTNGRVHSFETYRASSGDICHNIRTVSSKQAAQMPTGGENKEVGA